jgi:hypothetical protein
MKKIFLLVVAAVLFAYQSSFASKKGEFTFGVDKILTYSLRNSINYVDGQKVATKIENGRVVPIKEDKVIERKVDPGTRIVHETKVEVDKMVDNRVITSISRDYGGGVLAPKVEYCYYAFGQLDDVRMGIGLGVNKFFNSDFDPFNIYVIGKIVLPPINDKCNFSLGTNLGYGVFNGKYETMKVTSKADKVYSLKLFIKLDYKNFFVDLSAMTNIIPIDAKINTVHEGVRSVKKDIEYDVIMLGIGYKFAI